MNMSFKMPAAGRKNIALSLVFLMVLLPSFLLQDSAYATSVTDDFDPNVTATVVSGHKNMLRKVQPQAGPASDVNASGTPVYTYPRT